MYVLHEKEKPSFRRGAILLVRSIADGISVLSENWCLTIRGFSGQADIMPALSCQTGTVPHAAERSALNPSGQTQVLFHGRLVYAFKHAGCYPVRIMGVEKKV